MPCYPSLPALIRDAAPTTPLLCLSPRRVAERVRLFKAHFPGETSWAVKSNPHPRVVQAIVDAGIRTFDVASRQEIDLIRHHCPSAMLHFNHPVKTPDDIAYAIHAAGIRSFVIDSLEELEKIDITVDSMEAGQRSDITLTIRFRSKNAAGTGNYNFDEKFGIPPQEAAALLQLAAHRGYRTGLTFHPGSQNQRPESYALSMETARDIAGRAFPQGEAALAHLNIGGGFPCAYPGGNGPSLHCYFKAISQAAPDLACPLICEPGRALVAESTSLLTRIILRRRDDSRLYINDGIYGSFMEAAFVDFQPPARAYSADGAAFPEDEPREALQVWGATCDSLDRLRQPVCLPSAIRTGDFIEFGMMGAYTNATATRFNGIEPAGLVSVEEIAPWSADAKHA